MDQRYLGYINEGKVMMTRVLMIILLTGVAAAPAAAQRGNDWARQQQEQQRRQAAEQERQRQAAAERERQAAAARAREAERQRQQAVERARAQEAQRQAARAQEAARAAQTNARTSGVGLSPATKANAIASGAIRVSRQPSAAEIRRGFTGKVTADGKALVRFQGRIYAVPASRLGIRVRQASAENSNTPAASAATPRWTEARRAEVNADIAKLAGQPVKPRKERITSGFVDGNRLLRETPTLDTLPRPQERPPQAPANDSPGTRTMRGDTVRAPVIPKNASPGTTAIVIARPARTLTAAEKANDAEARFQWERVVPGGKPANGGFVSKGVRTLPAGTRLSRYGSEYGDYTSPEGTPYEGRGLPPARAQAQHRVYTVLKEIPVLHGEAATVENKRTGEVFAGGAEQYQHTMSIDLLVKQGYLAEVKPDRR